MQRGQGLMLTVRKKKGGVCCGEAKMKCPGDGRKELSYYEQVSVSTLCRSSKDPN